MQRIIFKEGDHLDSIVVNAQKKATLTEWLHYNEHNTDGRHLIYLNFPSEFVWYADGKYWRRRRRINKSLIGRLTYVHPAAGDLFYLRMLLCHQTGCKSLPGIQLVNDVVYPTCRAACEALGLLEDDQEWEITLQEAGLTATPTELRTLLAHILTFCQVSHPVRLWRHTWKSMSEDIPYTSSSSLNIPNLHIDDSDLLNYVLYELEGCLNHCSISLADFGFRLPPEHLMAVLRNRLLMEENSYERRLLANERDRLLPKLNHKQRYIFNLILDACFNNMQQFVFLYGHGGTGKTFPWKTIIYTIRSQGKIVLVVASSGIASLLLPAGRTAHSRFKITLDPTETTVCSIKKNTESSKLIKETCLIIWDEYPLNDRRCFETLDRTLRDVLDEPDRLFGDREKVTAFAQWLLDIGNGHIGTLDESDPENTSWIDIPEGYCIRNGDHGISTLINFIYDDDTLHNPPAAKLQEKIIVCSKNDVADVINAKILSLLPGTTRVYISYDDAIPHGHDGGEVEMLYPREKHSFISWLTATYIRAEGWHTRNVITIMAATSSNPDKAHEDTSTTTPSSCTSITMTAEQPQQLPLPKPPSPALSTTTSNQPEVIKGNTCESQERQSTQRREPVPVQILSVHLQNMQRIIFKEGDHLDSIVVNAQKKATLTEWLHYNEHNTDGRHLIYLNFPSEFVWYADGKYWRRRRRINKSLIGRLTYVHPAAGDLFYLRMLLCHQTGCKSLPGIQLVNDVVYPTCRAACEALGLLEDDQEWEITLQEAGLTATPTELRTLLAHILTFCQVSHPVRLWRHTWKSMSEDIPYTSSSSLNIPNLHIDDSDLLNYVLYELEGCLNHCSISLADFGFRLPPEHLMAVLRNRLLMEENSYERRLLANERDRLLPKLNHKQRYIFNLILDACFNNMQQFVFLYGHGGTGKTFPWKTIIYTIRSQGKIVLVVASSGIASLLLPAGRTAHSRFKITLDPTETTVCSIKKNTESSKLIKETCLIIWDEYPLNDRRCFETLDRTLRDVLDEPDRLFGDREKVTAFAQWLLDIGNGHIGTLDESDPENTSWIDIPEGYCIRNGDHGISTLINFIYDDDTLHNPPAAKLQEKIIVCSKNDVADVINAKILSLLPGTTRVYISYDDAIPHGHDGGEVEMLYPREKHSFISWLTATYIRAEGWHTRNVITIMAATSSNPDKAHEDTSTTTPSSCTSITMTAEQPQQLPLPKPPSPALSTTTSNQPEVIKGNTCESQERQSTQRR
nr:DNA helicase [Tanacetum cinerariifolium]